MITNPIIDGITTLCSRLDGVAAVVLIGSRARAVMSEKAADWDLLAIMRTEKIPEESERRKLWSSPESPVARARMYFGSCNDRFALDGENIGIDYDLNLPSLQNRLRQILEAGEIGRTAKPWFCLGECAEVICADLESCVALWDPDGHVARWKDMVSRYPQRFRKNLIQEGLFETRFHLKDMRRGLELGDIPVFHGGLSEVALSLLRVLFAVNRRWFPGLKYAVAASRVLPAVPDGWLDDLERLLRRGLVDSELRKIHVEAASLAVRLARMAAALGEEERKAVKGAAWEWPDVDPVDFNDKTTDNLPPNSADNSRA